MIIKSMVTQNKNGIDEILNLDVLVERLKKLRALNKKPDKIGLTQYTWRSFSINKIQER